MSGTHRPNGSKALTRRDLVSRAAALGVSVPALSGMLAAEAGAQATPAAAAPTGDPIRIGAAVSTTGSNGRTGLYQQEAYLLWESQKNASGGLLGRPVRQIFRRTAVQQFDQRFGRLRQGSRRRFGVRRIALFAAPPQPAPPAHWTRYLGACRPMLRVIGRL